MADYNSKTTMDPDRSVTSITTKAISILRQVEAVEAATLLMKKTTSSKNNRKQRSSTTTISTATPTATVMTSLSSSCSSASSSYTSSCSEDDFSCGSSHCSSSHSSSSSFSDERSTDAGSSILEAEKFVANQKVNNHDMKKKTLQPSSLTSHTDSDEISLTESLQEDKKEVGNDNDDTADMPPSITFASPPVFDAPYDNTCRSRLQKRWTDAMHAMRSLTTNAQLKVYKLSTQIIYLQRELKDAHAQNDELVAINQSLLARLRAYEERDQAANINNNDNSHSSSGLWNRMEKAKAVLPRLLFAEETNPPLPSLPPKKGETPGADMLQANKTLPKMRSELAAIANARETTPPPSKHSPPPTAATGVGGVPPSADNVTKKTQAVVCFSFVRFLWVGSLILNCLWS